MVVEPVLIPQNLTGLLQLLNDEASRRPRPADTTAE
jgi:hypothetical protein